MIDNLVGWGARIFENFASFIHFLHQNGVNLDGHFITYFDILIGGAIAIMITAVLIKWILDFVT